MRRGSFFLVLIILLGAFIYLAPLYFKGSLLDPNTGVLNWGLVATIFVSLTVLGFFFEFERAATGAKEIALVSMLGTISALSRLPFAALLNFQPCTFFIICSGYVFGPTAGFMVACLTALL
jgi:energy-coupling factor transport system substrate-specific component